MISNTGETFLGNCCSFAFYKHQVRGKTGKGPQCLFSSACSGMDIFFCLLLLDTRYLNVSLKECYLINKMEIRLKRNTNVKFYQFVA
jgi:hypothetical protein